MATIKVITFYPPQEKPIKVVCEENVRAVIYDDGDAGVIRGGKFETVYHNVPYIFEADVDTAPEDRDWEQADGTKHNTVV